MFVLQQSFARLERIFLWGMFSLFPPFPTHCLLRLLPPFFCPSFPSKVMNLMKVQCCPRSMMIITSCTPHLSQCFFVAALHLSLFSFPSFILSVCHSLSHLLISYSTFHQLLVSPNSCHVDVDGLGTFRLTPCKCGSLKWRVG